MFRKLMLGAMAAVGIGFGTQAATAGEPVFAPHAGQPVFAPVAGPVAGFHPPRVDYDYIVMIQQRGCWERYGRFETLHEARRVERRLEREGFRVRIEEVRDRRW